MSSDQRSPTSESAWAIGQYWSYRLAHVRSLARELEVWKADLQNK